MTETIGNHIKVETTYNGKIEKEDFFEKNPKIKLLMPTEAVFKAEYKKITERMKKEDKSFFMFVSENGIVTKELL